MSKAKTTDTRTDDELRAMLQAFRALTATEQSAYLTEQLWLKRDAVKRRRAALAVKIARRGMN